MNINKMQFIKKQKIMLFLIAVVIIGVLLGVFVVSKKIDRKSDAGEVVAVLHKSDFGSSFSGVFTEIEDNWSLYRNDTLGFEIEYPFLQKPRESFRKKTDYDWVYTINFSTEFKTVLVNIMPSGFETINEWIEQNPDYKKPNNVFVRRNISGVSAVTVYHIAEFPPILDEQVCRDTYIIKDGVLYNIYTCDVESKDYERIWSSFKFIN